MHLTTLTTAIWISTKQAASPTAAATALVVVALLGVWSTRWACHRKRLLGLLLEASTREAAALRIAAVFGGHGMGMQTGTGN
jgi:hypothetical protein